METAYAPKPDGRPDPGEIVWGWVPYEEDSTPASVRREGAVLDEARFNLVVTEMRRHLG